MSSLYDVAKKLFFVIPPIVCPFQFVINAPFGRFSPSADSIFLFDGVRTWIAMEIVAPIVFVNALVNNPLASSSADTQPLGPAQLILAGLFLVHYTNRAILSPLRTPSRSKSHIAVAMMGITFNVVNASLLGTYFHTSIASNFLAPAFTRPLFWVGIAIWVVGLAGNILHDEILLNIRRNAQAKGKAKAKSDDDDKNGAPKKAREHYGIPHGYLYRYISYPNYFCEWIEWFGFALAAAPVPLVTSLNALVSSVQPPWVFFSSAFFLTIGRAYNGHRWYLEKFPDYPKDRKVVVPHIF